MSNKSIALRVSESSAAGEARRVAMGMAENIGFGPVKTGEVGIIVSEMATNLWRHAGHGEIILREVTELGQTPASTPDRGMEILSIDKGPGMADVEKCLRDGYSTGGSAGIGLGAVARLSTSSEIYSRPEKGTVCLSMVWKNPRPRLSNVRSIGAICVPVKEEAVCGDAWAEKFGESGQQLLLVDGLGHGFGAASAADVAIKVFQEKELNAKEMIEALNSALKNTVGAVVGLAEITPRGRIFSFIGLGNIAGKIITGENRKNLLSRNGTVGLALPVIRQEEYSWSNDSLLILHSDGVSSRWDLENYPGLAARHPSIIAGVLYRDHRRERDDASIIVMRELSG
ncbi:MAG: ATP-binding SpoIIE family protein phosphatase [Verrucomicrobiota bacterium]